LKTIIHTLLYFYVREYFEIYDAVSLMLRRSQERVHRIARQTCSRTQKLCAAQIVVAVTTQLSIVTRTHQEMR